MGQKICPNCGQSYTGAWHENCPSKQRTVVSRMGGRTVKVQGTQSILGPEYVDVQTMQPAQICQNCGRTTWVRKKKIQRCSKCGNASFTDVNLPKPTATIRLQPSATRGAPVSATVAGPEVEARRRELQQIQNAQQRAISGGKNFNAYCTQCKKMHPALTKTGTPHQLFDRHILSLVPMKPHHEDTEFHTAIQNPKTENTHRNEYMALLRAQKNAELEGTVIRTGDSELDKFIHNQVPWPRDDDDLKLELQYRLRGRIQAARKGKYRTATFAEKQGRKSGSLSSVFPGIARPPSVEGPPLGIKAIPLRKREIDLPRDGDIISLSELQELLRRSKKAGTGDSAYTRWLRTQGAATIKKIQEHNRRQTTLPGGQNLEIRDVRFHRSGSSWSLIGRNRLGGEIDVWEYNPERSRSPFLNPVIAPGNVVHEVTPFPVRRPPDIAKVQQIRSHEVACATCGLIQPRSQFAKPNARKPMCNNCREDFGHGRLIVPTPSRTPAKTQTRGSTLGAQFNQPKAKRTVKKPAKRGK